MKQKTYHYYQDAGHGWVKVPMMDLRLLGIENRITSFSYVKGDNAYLEEDCDASTFIEALEAKGLEFKYKSHISNRSAIRNYQSYGGGFSWYGIR